MKNTQQARNMKALPETKAQRMNRLKESWAQIGQAEQASAAAFDVQRATLLAEALAEPRRYEDLTLKDIAQATGCTHPRITQLLRYLRFMTFAKSSDVTAVTSETSEGRFRDYWKGLSDSQTMKRLKHKDKTTERLAYERSVFPLIIQHLEAGTPPPKKQTARRVKPWQIEDDIEAFHLLIDRLSDHWDNPTNKARMAMALRSILILLDNPEADDTADTARSNA